MNLTKMLTSSDWCNLKLTNFSNKIHNRFNIQREKIITITVLMLPLFLDAAWVADGIIIIVMSTPNKVVFW